AGDFDVDPMLAPQVALYPSGKALLERLVHQLLFDPRSDAAERKGGAAVPALQLDDMDAHARAKRLAHLADRQFLESHFFDADNQCAAVDPADIAAVGLSRALGVLARQGG